ncbi:LD-carboxypeptidase [uncultured Piscinibacter sp.]|uniref:LD-carboxypeptidase n=1 Tax=uncultured Piscinibacter sp. TaxID=1131835 RepID=UPI00260BDC0D|nr:LD-carboxypeptidase [uncultured Piscinibacter sp.]
MTSLTLFTPSGVVASARPLRLAARRLARLGFDVQLDEAALDRHQRFGGDDDTRLAALHRVASQAPSIAMATRGGYGLTRLLDRIDWKRVARSVEQGTRWVGHSDLTVLQLGLLAHGRGRTWAGPMACYDFGREAGEHGEKTAAAVDEVTRDCFLEAMSGELEAVGFRTEAGYDGLDVKGVLWGGNLCMVSSLLGTPHWPRIRGGVLFLEDVNEHPYRVERSLLQLQQAGVLDAQKAVLLGAFTDWKKSPLDRGYTMKSMVAKVRSATRAPILTGLPFGHVPTKLTLPVGARVQLVVQARDVLIGW